MLRTPWASPWSHRHQVPQAWHAHRRLPPSSGLSPAMEFTRASLSMSMVRMLASRALEAGGLNLIHSSAILCDQLCDPGQVPVCLCASISSSVRYR